jgi:hypothetical protein
VHERRAERPRIGDGKRGKRFVDREIVVEAGERCERDGARGDEQDSVSDADEAMKADQVVPPDVII